MKAVGGLARSRLKALFSARSAANAVGHGVFANLLIAGANILTGVIVARTLGAEGRGYLAALIALPSLLPAFLTLGIPTTAVYEVRSHPDTAAGVMGFNASLGVLLSAIGTLGAVLAVPYYLNDLPVSLQNAALVMAALTFPSALITFLLAGLQARQSFAAYNALRYAHPLIVLLLTGLLAAGHLLSPTTAALIVLTAGLPGLVWCALHVYRDYRPNLRWTRDSLNRWLTYGARAYSTDLLLAAASQIDKLIVVSLFAPATLGVYTVAVNLSRLAAMFSTAVVTVLFPRAAGRPLPEVIALTGRAAGATLFVTGAIAMFLIAAGHMLLVLVYGREFGMGAVALDLLVLEALLSSLIQVLGQAFLALNRPGIVSMQYVLGLATSVPLLFLLAPRFGAAGAASSLLAGAVVRLVATYASFPLSLGVPPPGVSAYVLLPIQRVRGALSGVRR